jgi:hypothetical protein
MTYAMQHDHVQCVPKCVLVPPFAQVTTVPPEVCKTVGLLHAATSAAKARDASGR